MLNAIDAIEQHLLGDTHGLIIDILYVQSFLSVIKETHQALNDNDPEQFTIPQDQALIAQELLLFESGSDDVYDFSDADLQVARINLRMRWENLLNFVGFADAVKESIQPILKAHGLENVDIKVVGLVPMFAEVIHGLINGTLISYSIALLVVFLAMVLLMGSLRRGLLTFIPNVLPIVFTVGIIGWLVIPLNIMTSTIGCIIIGIAVDDTIHFMHHFRRFAVQAQTIEEAVHQTLHTCGRAIFFTSVVLIGGFIVHLTGELSTNKEFGWLLSLAIFLALMANLVVAPALLTLFWRVEKADQN